jgi:hypothetical protein
VDATAFRRYLQPSPTLRWHPWAPLLMLLMAFGFVFEFGVKVGSRAARQIDMDPWYSQASMVRARITDQQKGGIQGVIWDANVIDNAVRQRVRVRENPRSGLETFRHRLEGLITFGFWRRDDGALIDESVRKLAEWRLANLAGDAPAWRATASYCDSTFAPFVPADVGELWSSTADAYSKFLGRKVTGAQLAPVVPGGHCMGRKMP